MQPKKTYIAKLYMCPECNHNMWTFSSGPNTIAGGKNGIVICKRCICLYDPITKEVRHSGRSKELSVGGIFFRIKQNAG